MSQPPPTPPNPTAAPAPPLDQLAPVIDVQGLGKRFGAVEALTDVSFKVARGKSVGLLGPNGAGKTTTIHLLLGLTTPSSGRIGLLGLDLKRHRRRIMQRINFVSSEVSLPANLTAWESLNIFAKLYGLRRPRAAILSLLESFGIEQALKRRAGSLSSGQLTRLNLCKALLNDPELLLLDEPTASLDPDMALTVRQRLKSLQEERGLTIVYTSHNMREIEAMCQRVIFLRRGRVALTGTPAEITRAAAKGSLEEVFIDLARREGD
jgi:ABC-2 type transport system ATP-binding protein